MSSKHFINDPTKLVLDSLSSWTLVNPTLGFQSGHKIVYRKVKSSESAKVSIISGGGSGHEPGFSGYVGKGLLAAAVAGSIFASPSAEQVREGFECVPTEKGVLILIMNYTGDILNFGMALEDARLHNVQVEMVAVGDDVAVGRTKGGNVGRRGLVGTVLVMKACGELAERGHSLEEVTQLAQQVAANTVTIGASLDRVHVLGRQFQAEPLPKNKIELGMGIHNESGCDQVELELPALVERMLRQLLTLDDTERGFISLKPQDDMVLLVNNLGGISPLELGAIVTEVSKQLGEVYDLKASRVFAGAFLTSMNGSGFSITLLKVTPIMFDHSISLLDLLDSPCEAAGWSAFCPKSAGDAEYRTIQSSKKQSTSAVETSGRLRIDIKDAKHVLTAGLLQLVAAEPLITQFDAVVGDGDCGSNMKRGAEAILDSLQNTSDAADAIELVAGIKKIVETSMDGTSGALLTIFLSGLIQGLQGRNTTSELMDASVWSSALKHGLSTLAKYTPARPGDRTMMDALEPFIEVYADTMSLAEAVSAAERGAEHTKGLKASLGRSVYVGLESDWIGKIPDPGAYAVKEFLQGVLNAGKL